MLQKKHNNDMLPPNITGCWPEAEAPADEPSPVSAEVLNI